MEQQSYTQPDPEAKFNAGVAIAEHLHQGFCEATSLRLLEDWSNLYKLLATLEIKLSTPLRSDKKTAEELKKLKDKYLPVFFKYTKKRYWAIQNEQTIKTPYEVVDFLSEYERQLLFLRDRAGYGMPTKASAKDAAFR